MKGNPLLRFALAAIVLGLVFWPVYRITSRPDGARQPPAATPAMTPLTGPMAGKPIPVTLLLHAAPEVEHCSIRQGGKVLLSQENRVGRGDYEVETSLIKGEDLLIEGEWRDDDPHALRAGILSQGSHELLEKTYWAGKSLKDTLVVPESFMP